MFFADGGIESANFLAYLACGSLLVAAMFALRSPKNLNKEIGIAVSLLLITAFILAISISNRGYVNYYSTKTIVGLLSALVCLVGVTQSKKLKHEIMRSRRIALMALVIGFALTQIFVAPLKSKMIFVGPFQGRVYNSFAAVLRKEPGPLHVEVVGATLDGFCDSRPALYISRRYDSELTTRWVNSLREEWTDSTWGTWSKIRDLITQDQVSRGDWAVADSTIVESNFSLILDEASLDNDFVNDISANLPRAFQAGLVCAF